MPRDGLAQFLIKKAREVEQANQQAEEERRRVEKEQQIIDALKKRWREIEAEKRRRERERRRRLEEQEKRRIYYEAVERAVEEINSYLDTINAAKPYLRHDELKKLIAKADSLHVDCEELPEDVADRAQRLNNVLKKRYMRTKQAQEKAALLAEKQKIAETNQLLFLLWLHQNPEMIPFASKIYWQSILPRHQLKV